MPPAAVSTLISTLPTVPAGEVTVTEVELLAVIVAGEVPKRTRTVFVKLVPPITMEVVPPAVVPFGIEIDVILGGGTKTLTSWERSTF